MRAQPTELKEGAAGAFRIDSAPRWGEGMPHLATTYMVKALKGILASLER